jgi:hypothetical protein
LASQSLNDSPVHLRAILGALPTRHLSFVDAIFRLETLSPDDTDYLRTLPAGLVAYNLSIPSLSEDACRAVGRRALPLEEIRRRLEPLKDHGPIAVDYDYPFPGETLDELRRNVDAILALGFIQVRINQLVMAPHLALGRSPETWGYVTESFEGLEFAVACQGFPPDDVARAQQWATAMAGAGRLANIDALSWQGHCARHLSNSWGSDGGAT